MHMQLLKMASYPKSLFLKYQKSPRVRVISGRGEAEADKHVLWGFLFSRHRPVYYFSYTVARKSLFPLCAAAGK
uniref:Uncharacterized protein n=1 Tax=Trichogramma kaykai TaxID=54128 RepID=A0ABD2WXC6_9HYME